MTRDPAAAKTTITPVLACPTGSSPALHAHVLRAQLAVEEKDWAAVRPAMAGVGLHPETRISVRAAAFVLGTDQALNDTRAFASDRAVILAGNDLMLTKIGRKIETFRAGKANVTGYEAKVEQGVLHRVLEFIITPDDPTAYPRSILLTDDVEAGKGQSEAMKQINGGHNWFIDSYDCAGHATLGMPIGAAQPSYDSVKTVVIKALEQGVTAITTSQQRHDDGLCDTISWILPGLGASLPSTLMPAPLNP